MHKNNEQNLKKATTHEQAVEWGRRGGLASAQSRQRKMSLKAIAKALADEKVMMPMADGKIEQVTYDVALVLSQYRKAIIDGDTRSATFIAELLGELKQRVELEGGGIQINVRTAEQADAVQAIIERE